MQNAIQIGLGGNVSSNSFFGTQHNPANLLGVNEYDSQQGTLNLNNVNQVPDIIRVSSGAVYLNDQCANPGKEISIHISPASLFSLQQGSYFNLRNIHMDQGGILDFNYENESYSFTAPKDTSFVIIPQMIKYTCENLKSFLLGTKQTLISLKDKIANNEDEKYDDILQNSYQETSSQLHKVYEQLKDFHIIKPLTANKTNVLNEFFFEIVGASELDQQDTYLGKDINSCIASFLNFNDVNYSLEDDHNNEYLLGDNGNFVDELF